MSRITRVRILLGLLFLVPLLFCGPGAAADIASLPSGTAAEIRRDGPTLVMFPAQLATGVKPRKVHAKLVTIVRDDNLQVVAPKVSAVWVAASRAIQVRIPQDAIVRPGTYIFNVALTSGKSTQLVPLTLTRGNADLTAPSSAKISLVDRPLRPALVGDSQLRIAIGPNDAITASDLAISQVESEPGTLEVTGSTVENSTILVHYQPTDGFPLGDSTRTLRVTGAKLAAPVQFTVTVTHRRTVWLIPLIVLLGTGSGFFLRNVIIPERDRTKARAQVAAFLAGPAFDDSYSTDPGYLEALQASRDSVSADETDPAKIQATLTAAATGIEQARAKLTESLAKQRDRLQALSYVGAGWNIPDALQPSLAKASDELGQAAAALRARNAEQAASSIDAALLDLERLRLVAKPALDRAASQLAALATALAPAGTPPVRDLGAAADRLAKTYEPADPTDTKAVLSALHASGAGADVLTALVHQLAPIVDGCREKLTVRNAVDPELTQAVDGLHAELADTTRAGLDKAASLAAAVSRVHHTLRATITRIAGQDDDLKKALSTFDDGRWLDGVVEVTQQQGGAQPQGQPALRAALPLDQLTAAEPGQPQPPATTPGLAPVITTPAIVLRRRSLRLDVAILVLLTLVTMIIAMQLYSGDWLGTWGQIGTLFTWAIALDLVSGGLGVALAAGAAKPAA